MRLPLIDANGLDRRGWTPHASRAPAEQDDPVDLNPAVTAAIVASLVSLVGAALSYLASTASARHQVESARQQLEQSQLREVILKRIEIYPKLWRIPIEAVQGCRRTSRTTSAAAESPSYKPEPRSQHRPSPPGGPFRRPTRDCP
ncbi:hypothetical protein [Micromonospora sp. CPCC 206061]|uniref:hypothetical protein n=1 Tax=Micromonospora sp. CPCC 206061 TaxID=3122410 RepID=UPI002FF0D727